MASRKKAAGNAGKAKTASKAKSAKRNRTKTERRSKSEGPAAQEQPTDLGKNPADMSTEERRRFDQEVTQGRQLNHLVGNTEQKATVEGTVGGVFFDGAKKRRPSPHDAGDKEEGGAARFHAEMDDKLYDQRQASGEAIGEHEKLKLKALRGDPDTPEEERRRAALSRKTGLDLWSRDRPGEVVTVGDGGIAGAEKRAKQSGRATA